MKAAIFSEYGGLDVLRIEDRPVPEIGPDEVLIRVRASSLNRLDLLMREGLTPIKPPLPHIGGAEVAGEIARLGADVTGFSEGQRVAVAPYLHDGTCPNCLLGEETTCLNGDILGMRGHGGHAEFVKVPANSLVGIPEALSFEEAAAQTLTTITAWHMLVDKAGVRPGETVLVLSAGSGVGSAAIQIAKLWGANVIATASRNDVLEKAKDLGADEVINYTDYDFAKEVRRLTGRRGVDIVVEHVGKDSWEKSLGSIASNGRIVVGGTTTGGDASLKLSMLFTRQVMILGAYGGTKADLKEVLRLTAEGRLQAVIDQTYPLDQIKVAEERLESRQQFGKLVLVP